MICFYIFISSMLFVQGDIHPNPKELKHLIDKLLPDQEEHHHIYECSEAEEKENYSLHSEKRSIENVLHIRHLDSTSYMSSSPFQIRNDNSIMEKLPNQNAPYFRNLNTTQYIYNISEENDYLNSEKLLNHDRVNHLQDFEDYSVKEDRKIPELGPYLASVHNNQGFICSATLIAAHYLLTSAHCVIKNSPLWFRIGSSHLNRGGKIHYISHVFINSGYNGDSNDIAMLRSKTPVQYDRYLQLPSQYYPDPTVNSLVVARGYAFKNNELKEQRVIFKIVDKYRCKNRTMASFRSIESDKICASAQESDPCFGDAGSSLSVYETLLGVLSWTSPSCAIRDPDVYTNIKEFVPWIYYIMKIHS